MTMIIMASQTGICHRLMNKILLRNGRYYINKIADNDGDPLTVPITHFDYYWSSTEAKAIQPLYFNLVQRDIATVGKNTALYHIRAVRKF
ncbi:MAG: hypothetical protein IPO72_10250 [Saprospiraceae bacterium]|nr:hypothetical protein [Candidatus Vicinibacter affinis]